jgi:hypothetical protein
MGRDRVGHRWQDKSRRHTEFLGKLLRRRFAAHFVEQLPGRARNPADVVDHVHGNADDFCLIGNAAGARIHQVA